jgi:outer membrane beta-barrel protein
MKRWLILLVLLALPGLGWTQAPEPRQRQDQAIEPRLERPDIVIPRIDDENFEVNLYTGILSIENFGSNLVYGLRGAFHMTEDFFLEASVGRSRVRDTAFRNAGIALFGDSERATLEHYSLVLAYNALPGEVFVGRRRAFTSALFLLAGAGNTRIASEDYFTYTLGLGFRVLPTDWLTLRVDVRDHIFSNDLTGERRRTHNPELSASVGVYF